MAWRKELNREELRRERGAHCVRIEKLPNMDMTTLADYIQVTLNVLHLQFVDHGGYFFLLEGGNNVTYNDLLCLNG